MHERVLVVAAHPDDDVLGCGGTIARHKQSMDNIRVVFVADRQALSNTAVDVSRRESANAACSVLGTEPPLFLGFPDQRLDTESLLDIIQKVEPIVEAFQPTIVYTHHGGDLNVDHRIVHQATITALRPIPGATCKGIFAFEVPSSTEWASGAIGEAFRPNHFVDITEFLDLKLKALAVYDKEMRSPPHSRSYNGLRALAALRGANSGLGAAEAFVTLRTIQK